ncbi:hypothetical protein SDRG_05825 [Saprolegnia diclina VS20]|uniref:Uncharacterized protein n=1 Tax=Saprolegnia diclina (strain VS20) TaxID=1156394 RepID=T0RWV4_SAPDV|nr:hypothetical protein SDRG_05825 [Saprolegnia diclina VS20]EQC37008.1 hypothetical protein SDRG_05825 [Saprolegnia diclina VS20]|eukprot:XP_008609789.1 hypothetical protein SDRG_05825 [Saprolegnia diclina VS20]
MRQPMPTRWRPKQRPLHSWLLMPRNPIARRRSSRRAARDRPALPHVKIAAPAAAPILNFAPAGTLVHFLGIYVGNRVDPAYQVQLISDRYDVSFQHWGYRARTLKGRRLLASSVMVSLLWHVTAVVVIPPKTVTAWQQMLTRYVLGRKRDPTEPYQSLLHASWNHHIGLGAGIPHIASAIRTQRLLTLQRLMLPEEVRPLWAPLVLAQFEECMGHLYRESHPFDFLCYVPHWGTKWITTSKLHPFWFDVWRQWSKTAWAKRVAVPPTYDMVTNMPVWLTTYEPMAIDTIRHAAKCDKHAQGRAWCLHGAGNGFRALRDFMTPSGHWFTWTELAARMRQGNPATRVHLHRQGRIVVSAARDIAAAYKHLCVVYDQVRRLHDIRTDVLLPRPAMTTHPFRKLVKDVVQPFQNWPRRDVRDLAMHAPAPRCPHPLLSTTRRTVDDVETYLADLRYLMRVAAPVHADVWFRLVLRMLPVNSRMYYFQHQEPEAILCRHGCGVVERVVHAFFKCPYIHPIWKWHDKAWRAFGAAV